MFALLMKRTILSLLLDDACEWNLFGQEVAVGQKITASAPAGSDIACSDSGSLGIESVGGTGITLRSSGSYANCAISIFAPIGDTVTVRSVFWGSSCPAIKVKVLSVDAETGIARLEVSQFWPKKKETQIDKVE